MSSNKEMRPWEKFSGEQVRIAYEVIRAYSGHPNWDLDSAGRVMGLLQDAMEDKRGANKRRWWLPTFLTKKQAEFEATHSLTEHPTIPSDTHWQLYHPVRVAGMSYVTRYNGVSGIIGGGKSLLLDDGPTNIRISKYTDSCQRIRVMFDIYRQETHTHEGTPYYELVTIQKYLSASTADANIDPDIVVYKNIQTGNVHYITFTPARDSNVVSVLEVEPRDTQPEL